MKSKIPIAFIRIFKGSWNFAGDFTIIPIGLNEEYMKQKKTNNYYIDSNFIMPKLENIRIIHLNYKRVILMIFPIIKFLIKEKQDYIFSAEDHLNTVLFFAKIIANSKTKISLSSRVTPYDTYSNFIFSKRWFLKNLNKLVIKKANVMSCVSTEMIDQYKKIFPNSKHVCIYNIIINDEAKIKMNEEVNHKWLNNKKKPVIIAAGKLAEWKGFKYLIEAFNILIKKKDARLIILGDGHLKNQLKILF